MSRHTTLVSTPTATDLEAFCSTCPDVEEVTAQLASLDLRLVFSMSTQHGQDTLPPIPAQYHYRDRQGTEVIYLAGRDSPLHTGELSLPPHESRFWLSCGGDANAFRLVLAHLAVRWRFQWQKVERGYDGDDEADDAVA